MLLEKHTLVFHGEKKHKFGMTGTWDFEWIYTLSISTLFKLYKHQIFFAFFQSMHVVYCCACMLCKYLSQGLILSVSTSHFEICFFKRSGRRSVDRLWVLNASFFFKQNFLSLKSLAFPLSSHTESLLSRFTQYSLVSKGGIFKHPEREDLPSADAASAKKLHLANFLLHNGFCPRGLKEQFGLVFSIWISG